MRKPFSDIHIRNAMPNLHNNYSPQCAEHQAVGLLIGAPKARIICPNCAKGAQSLKALVCLKKWNLPVLLNMQRLSREATVTLHRRGVFASFIIKAMIYNSCWKSTKRVSFGDNLIQFGPISDIPEDVPQGLQFLSYSREFLLSIIWIIQTEADLTSRSTEEFWYLLGSLLRPFALEKGQNVKMWFHIFILLDSTHNLT